MRCPTSTRWLLAALLPLALLSTAQAATPPLIPAPVHAQAGEGHFVLDASVRVGAGKGAQTTAAQFVTLLARSGGPQLAQDGKTTGKDKRIVFQLDPKAASTKEGYALEVTPQRVTVRAADARGLFYGAMSLWQLVPAGDASQPKQIAAVKIEDAPRFAWRGLMLDSARHFQQVDEIKALLDAMAVHKLNTFHWHLADDQGWRMPVDKYPKLIEVGSCRVPAGDAGKAADGSPATYCGYYTHAQIRDVVAYAAALHIEVVPEIDIPGHATAAIAAYPQLGMLDTRLEVGNEWGVYPNLFNADEPTMQFLEDVLAQVIALFPGRYVHVGGDEAVKDQWEASPKMQARMRALGVNDEMEMQSWMIKRMERFLVAHQRQLIGWDEILEGGLPPEATVMSWRGIEGGIDAARQGHDVVMSPVTHLYLDYLQTRSTDEPPGRPAMIDLEKVYGFEPVPAALDAQQRKHIIGVQANTFTEHMRSFERVQHAIFPRLAALAETAWSPQADKDYASFVARLPALLSHYRALKIDYADTPFQAQFTVNGDLRAGKAEVQLAEPLGYPVHYTTDGSAPTAASPIHRAPLALTLPATVQAQVFVDGQALAPATARTLSPTSLRSRSDEELAMCTDQLMLRLEDDGPREGAREIFNVDIFNPCWTWKQADLRDIRSLRVRAGRLPYLFQLAHDESHRGFKPANTAHGELVIRNGCEGPTLASVPMPGKLDADGFVDITVPLKRAPAQADLCVWFTGDTRPDMWVLDRLTLEQK
jgi:hexosaminidase